jgi:hypothetical protein
MHFAFEGFTQDGNQRCFTFRRIEVSAPTSIFSIEVDLRLFAQNRVSVQDGPSFCLELLTKALTAGPVQLEKLQSYQVVGDDFRPLLVEREKREAEKALKKRARTPYRRPGIASNLRMGKPVE